MEVVPASKGEIPALRALLRACALDDSDVDGEGAQRLLVAREGGVPVGCVALEAHGEAGLLRSFAVDPAWRRRGVGAALHAAVLRVAREAGVRDLYVLTTTVRDRALRDGFVDVTRDEVPAPLRAGRQFQGACPATASCMRLRLP